MFTVQMEQGSEWSCSIWLNGEKLAEAHEYVGRGHKAGGVAITV